MLSAGPHRAGTHPAEPRPRPGDACSEDGVRGGELSERSEAQPGILPSTEEEERKKKKNQTPAAFYWERAVTGHLMLAERGRNLVSPWEGRE